MREMVRKIFLPTLLSPLYHSPHELFEASSQIYLMCSLCKYFQLADS